MSRSNIAVPVFLIASGLALIGCGNGFSASQAMGADVVSSANVYSSQSVKDAVAQTSQISASSTDQEILADLISILTANKDFFQNAQNIPDNVRSEIVASLENMISRLKTDSNVQAVYVSTVRASFNLASAPTCDQVRPRFEATVNDPNAPQVIKDAAKSAFADLCPDKSL